MKVHEHRTLEQNRKAARLYLRQKLDHHLNGPMAVAAQKETIREEKSKKSSAKNKKRQLMKDQWRENNKEVDLKDETSQDDLHSGSEDKKEQLASVALQRLHSERDKDT